ncbi:MAG: response regulator [Planctomycetes bacterium]|nr:response regulator [Planctomycetota bacterium]
MPNVLIVDDDQTICEQWAEFLAKMGYDAVVAMNGAEAVYAVNEGADEIDAVILDLNLPDGSGAKIAKLIAAVAPQIPIVVISGFLDTTTQKELDQAKVVQTLSKPVKMSDFLSVIRRAIKIGGERKKVAENGGSSAP